MKETKYQSRHTDIFNPINQRYKIVIFGAGSLGSFITFNLAKLGFDNIEVYDMDKVQDVNVGVQLYRPQDIGKVKVDALRDIVKDFTDVEIVTHNEEVIKDTVLSFENNILYILTFDTLESRKLVFDLLKDAKCDVIDVRVGGEEMNMRITNTFNEKQLEQWKKSFDIKPTDLPCGAKSIIYTNFVVAGEVCNIVKKMNNEEKYPTRMIRHMKNYMIINDQNRQETDKSPD